MQKHAQNNPVATAMMRRTEEAIRQTQELLESTRRLLGESRALLRNEHAYPPATQS